MILHVVKSGETLASIAAVYGVSEARLRYDNQLADPALLVPGQALLVLIPELVYTVKPDVYKRQAYYTIDTKSYTVSKGDILILNAGVVHAACSDREEPVERWSCAFRELSLIHI